MSLGAHKGEKMKIGILISLFLGFAANAMTIPDILSANLGDNYGKQAGSETVCRFNVYEKPASSAAGYTVGFQDQHYLNFASFWDNGAQEDLKWTLDEATATVTFKDQQRNLEAVFKFDIKTLRVNEYRTASQSFKCEIH